MVLPQVIAVFHALFDVVGLSGNLLVIATIVLQRRFHVLRYILLASLAVSDFLLLILVNSFRIASIAQESWIYGETMCHLNAFFARYFYLNTILHLIAVSYERYRAIVKSPLTYDGTVTASGMVFIILVWVIPIPPCIGPFLRSSIEYVYNPKVFYCDQGWSVWGNSSAGWKAMFFAIAVFVVPLLVIILLNWSVYKTAKSQINALEVQTGSLDGLEGAEGQRQEMSRRIRERKAAVDVVIIIAAFLLCFLPTWIVGICRSLDSTDVPAEVMLVTSCIFFVTSLCNPIIYSIRKREFRTAIKKIMRQIVELCGNCKKNQINVIGIRHNFSRFNANLDTEASNSTPAALASLT